MFVRQIKLPRSAGSLIAISKEVIHLLETNSNTLAPTQITKQSTNTCYWFISAKPSAIRLSYRAAFPIQFFPKITQNNVHFVSKQ